MTHPILQEHFPTNSNIDSKGRMGEKGLLQRTNQHKKGKYNKCTHAKKNIYIYVGKSAFLRISLARIYAVLCAGRRDMFVCVSERDTIRLLTTAV